MRGNINLTNSVWDFYKLDIIIAVLMITCYLLLLYICKIKILPIIAILFIVMTILFFLDHKLFIIFNKSTNTLTIVKKALFVSKHMIIKQRLLTDYVTANLTIQYDNRGRRTYGVDMVSKYGGVEHLLPYSTSNRIHIEEMVSKIVNFYAGNETYMEFVESPFFYRVFATLSLIVLFYGSGFWVNL